MTTKTDTEQTRADFEAWTGYSEEALSRDAGDRYCIKGIDNEWRAYQAGRAALQSQDREDTDRLDWLAGEEAQIQSLTLANGTRYRLGWPDDGEAQPEWFRSPREAIDHARRIEGEGE